MAGNKVILSRKKLNSKEVSQITLIIRLDKRVRKLHSPTWMLMKLFFTIKMAHSIRQNSQPYIKVMFPTFLITLKTIQSHRRHSFRKKNIKTRLSLKRTIMKK